MNSKHKFALLMVITYLVSAHLVELTRIPMLYAIVTLPGTFFHELAHYLFAFIMGGQPESFSLIPEVSNGIIRLGSVDFYPSTLNAATVALAPMLLFPLTGFFVARALSAKTTFRQFLYLYCATCTWCSCTPSNPDLAVAASEPTSIPIAFILLGLLFVLTFSVLRRMLCTIQ